MKIAIIGLGHIGGSLAIDLQEKKIASRVFGIDISEISLSKALEKNIITDIGTWQNIEEMDLVVLSTPVDVIADIAPKVLDKVRDDAMVIDVGSTKLRIIQSINHHIKRENFIATHPIAGKEFSGIESAISGLFKNKVCILCDTEDSNRIFAEKIVGLFKNLGCQILHMDAHEHDQHIAYVSHLSHISSFALSNTVLELEKKEKNIFNLAGSGFESTVRLAKSNPDMWAAIFENNKNNVLVSLKTYIDQLKKFQEILEQDKPKVGLTDYITVSNRIKKILK